MRILITGAGGFIGANLCRAFPDDDVHAFVRAKNVWRLARAPVTLHEGEITDAASVDAVVEDVRPNAVFHFAQYGGNRDEKDEKKIKAVIEGGTRNLYEACIRAGVERVVAAGSSSEYGTKNEPMREDMPCVPTTPYGKAKLLMTEYAKELCESGKLPVTVLRFFSVYGSYEAPPRLFPNVILALLAGRELSLSNPANARDFVHVDDAVIACKRALSAPCGVYNVGTGVSSTIKEAVDEIAKALGIPAPTNWGSEKGRSFETTLWQADTEKATRELGFTAALPLSEGVACTVEWFKEHQHLYA